MTANIHGLMCYSKDIPMWHNIVPPSDKDMKAEEILIERFKGGFPIVLRPITVELNGVQVQTKEFAIVRGNSPYDNQEVVFGYCTERYLPLQPIEVCQSFDANVCEPAETMAFLGKGEEMFISWKMPAFDMVSGDTVLMYGIVRTGFDTLKGARLFTSIFRPVCSNTVNLAQGWAEQNSDGNGKGMIWKGKGVNKHLIRDLGFWLSHVQGKALAERDLIQSFLGNLAKTPIKNDAEVYELLFEAYPSTADVTGYYPEQLRSKKAEVIADYNAGQKKIQDGIYRLFSGEGTAITPDYYGLFNATSEYFCHVQPSKRPIAESVMFGGRQKNTMAMVSVLSERVKNG